MEWEQLIYYWYLLLFPILLLINKAEKNVAICFSLLIFTNVYIFDVIGIKASVWFLTQAYFDLLFVVAALLIRNKYIMYAAIIICSHSFIINIIEHLSEKQSVFYSLWEYINLLTIDLLAMCLVVDKRLNKQRCGDTE